MEPWAAAKKSFKLVWRCHQFLSGFLAKGYLPQSVTSVANDKGDNEMILEAVHRSFGICLTAEENCKKPQLGDRLVKGLCDQSSPQIRSLSSKWGRQDRTAEERKEGRVLGDVGNEERLVAVLGILSTEQLIESKEDIKNLSILINSTPLST